MVTVCPLTVAGAVLMIETELVEVVGVVPPLLPVLVLL
jgi:hypothetical protein